MKIQGIKKYCDKESYITRILKHRKQIFENLIGSDIENIHTEVRLNKNKIRVDLVCELDKGALAFVEVSIRHRCVKDFITHRNQLISILDFIGKDRFAYIILMSPDFLNEDIKNIEELIASYNVYVYFVYIPKELILEIQKNINIKLDTNEEFISNNLNDTKCIKIASTTVNTDKLFMLPLNKEQCGNIISQSILKGLREKTYWHLSVHRYKDLTKNIIKIGSGTSDIILNIYCNMNDKIIVEIDFANRLNIFNVFKDYMADMSEEIESSINIVPDKSKIFTEIPIFTNKTVAINSAINIATGYLEYITKLYSKIQL